MSCPTPAVGLNELLGTLLQLTGRNVFEELVDPIGVTFWSPGIWERASSYMSFNGLVKSGRVEPRLQGRRNFLISRASLCHECGSVTGESTREPNGASYVQVTIARLS